METKGLAIKFVKRICTAGGLNKYAPVLFSKLLETGYLSTKKKLLETGKELEIEMLHK